MAADEERRPMMAASPVLTFCLVRRHGDGTVLFQSGQQILTSDRDFVLEKASWVLDLHPHWENYIHWLSSVFGIHYASLWWSEATHCSVIKREKEKKKKSRSLCWDWSINCSFAAVVKHRAVCNYFVFLLARPSICKTSYLFLLVTKLQSRKTRICCWGIK